MQPSSSSFIPTNDIGLYDLSHLLTRLSLGLGEYLIMTALPSIQSFEAISHKFVIIYQFYPSIYILWIETEMITS